MKFKRGQVTIFIIVAIILVISVALFFVFKDKIFSEKAILPSDLQPVYSSFLNCIEEKTLVGVNILGSQGGYIYLPDFESGSAYSPFSSQLIFLDNPIPYWYYVSGNNIQKEQVPTKNEMQEQLARFIEDKISSCSFDSFYEQGFVIYFDEPNANTIIYDDKIAVNIKMNFGIEGLENNAIVSDHKLEVNTKLGTLYNSAKKIYDYEQDTLFLENYAIDTLRNYAPVDGVELQCSPMIWNAEDVFDELEEAIEMNTLSLRGSNNDFYLKDKTHQYFVVDLPVKEQVYFLNSRGWPSSFEVSSAKGSMLIAEPVGNEPGLGMLGFCYVPYHFVYSVKYPVLIQVVSGNPYDGEVFQFPLAVVIDKNMPREPYRGTIVTEEISDFCEYKNTEMAIEIYDINYNSINADISYQCAGTTCNIGSSEDGFLLSEFPQCTNGYLIARADGYEDLREIISTTESSYTEIFLIPNYEMKVDLELDSVNYGGEAIVTFLNLESGFSRTILYPNQNSVNLSTGQYEVQVYIYKNSDIKIPKSVAQQCVEVPRSGVGAFFGLTEEKCYDIEIPEQIVSNSLHGGGKQNYYILDEELRNSRVVRINAESLSTPKTLEQLQMNYLLFEEKGLEVEFR